jgi:hypothetical protein
LVISLTDFVDRFEQRNSLLIDPDVPRTNAMNPQDSVDQDSHISTLLSETIHRDANLENKVEAAVLQRGIVFQRDRIEENQKLQTLQDESESEEDIHKLRSLLKAYQDEKKMLLEENQKLRYSQEVSEKQLTQLTSSQKKLLEENQKLQKSQEVSAQQLAQLISSQNVSEQLHPKAIIENLPGQAAVEAEKSREKICQDQAKVAKMRKEQISKLHTTETEEGHVLSKELKNLEEMLEFRLKTVVNTGAGEVVKTYIDRDIDDDEVFMECWLEISSDKPQDQKLDQKLPLKTVIESHRLNGIAKTLKQAWELNLDELKEKFVSFPLEKFWRFKKSNVPDSVQEVFDYILLHASLTRAKAVSRKSIERFIAEELSTSETQSTLGKDQGVLIVNTVESPCKDLTQAMKDIAESLLPTPEDGCISFWEFKTAMRRVPRVCGHRIQFAQSLDLDKALARHLLPGKVDDGLDGIKKMIAIDGSMSKLDIALDAFCEDARRIVIASANKLCESLVSSSAQEANNKFHGFTGDFADLPDFYVGAEETIHLAYPNPNTMKGICDEHLAHPSANKVFVTGNYFIATCLRVELYWARDPSSRDPTTQEFLKQNANEYAEHDTKNSLSGKLLYPGENGDMFKESLFIWEGSVAEQIDQPQIKLIKEKMKSNFNRSKLEQLLMGDQNMFSNKIRQARGIRFMDHDSCVERLKKERSIITKTETKTETESSEANDVNLMIGIIFPMAKKNLDISSVENLVKSWMSGLVPLKLTVKHPQVTSITNLYCLHPSVQSLRKRIAELSEHELREEAEDKWMIFNTSFETNLESLRNLVIKSYVQTELQNVFKAALETAFEKDEYKMKIQTKELLATWPSSNDANYDSMEKSKLIENAVGKLDSEETWMKIEKWVQLYCVRIQGRARMPIGQIENQKQDQKRKYNLGSSEMLAAYLYTGPCFMPYNGVYRQYPPSIVQLLKGDVATGTPDNTLSTTLYCISSSLIKISRKTELPTGGKVYRGLGSMALPSKFWVPTGNPAWKGGVERAIMSTTTEKDVAVFYSSGKGTVAEISIGRIQMGGEMSWISMVCACDQIYSLIYGYAENVQIIFHNTFPCVLIPHWFRSTLVRKKSPFLRLLVWRRTETLELKLSKIMNLLSSP